jgi:uncharacterized membrane protein (UPF0127 family)
MASITQAFLKSVAMAGLCLSVSAWAGCEQRGDGTSSASQASPAQGAAPKAPAVSKNAKVTIAGEAFDLELAIDDETRFRGLSGRTEIARNGGMLFVFPDASVREQGFVMRDCPIPIDIVYVGRDGRVVSMFAMTSEAPRADDERELSPPFSGAPRWAWVNAKYEARLRQYYSRYPAQYVIELAGGRLKDLKVKEGDLIEFDREALKKRAK